MEIKIGEITLKLSTGELLDILCENNDMTETGFDLEGQELELANIEFDRVNGVITLLINGG